MEKLNGGMKNKLSAAAEKVVSFSKLVKFTHTVFALPFALSGLALATTVSPFSWNVLLWVLVAMVTARSAAMSFNRIVDRKFDALNPRTADREIPAGKISIRSAWIFVLLSSGLFVLSAFMLNPLCGWLSPVALAVLFFYSLTKRFTWAAQIFLGISLGISPIGAWLALTGSMDPRILVLSGAVLFWVAGFDIYYSCLDFDFDKKAELMSVPTRWGIKGAIRIARLQHLVTAVFILSLYFLFPLSWVYLAGAIIVIIILVIEDFIVKHDDLSRAMLAFNLNGAVSILFFLSIVAGLVFK